MLLWIISWDNSGELSAQESWLPAVYLSSEGGKSDCLAYTISIKQKL